MKLVLLTRSGELHQLGEIARDFFAKLREANKAAEDSVLARIKQVDAAAETQRTANEAAAQADRLEIAKQREAFETEKKEFDTRNPRHVRRKQRDDLLEALKKRGQEFRFGFGTNLRFVTVFAAYIVLLWWLGSSVISLQSQSLQPQPAGVDYPYWVSIGRQAATGLAFVIAFAFFIKWLNWWLRQHSEKELHFIRLHDDFARANWLVETVSELKEAAEDDEVTEIVKLVGHGMFVEEQSEEVALSAFEAIGSSIKGGSIEAGDLKISIPSGVAKKTKRKPTTGSH